MSVQLGLALWARHGSRSRSDKINLFPSQSPRRDILSLPIESSSYKRVTMQLLCVAVDAVVERLPRKIRWSMSRGLLHASATLRLWLLDFPRELDTTRVTTLDDIRIERFFWPESKKNHTLTILIKYNRCKKFINVTSCKDKNDSILYLL